MGRKPYYSAEDKMQIVLSVLRGETTQTEVARRLQMSQTTIAKWQKQFLEGGAEGLARGDRPVRPASKREEELEAQVADLTSALGEAYVELRIFRKGGLFTLVPRDRGRALGRRHVRHPPHRETRHTPLHLLLLEAGRRARPQGTAPAGPSRHRDHLGSRRVCRPLLGLGAPQDLGAHARRRGEGIGIQRASGA